MNPVLCLLCIMLIPLAAAGLALIHQGLGRSRSAAHAMLATLCAIGIAAIVFVLVGFSFTGFQGGPAHTIALGNFRFDWLGAAPLGATGLRFDNSMDLLAALTLCFHIFAVGIAAIIPISAGSDRWRLGPICGATALMAAVSYPLFSHW